MIWKDIVPAPRGIPKIGVSFDIDANGIIHVSAKDQNTGKEQNIRIDRPNLNEYEISQMVKEAALYEEQDRKRKEVVTCKNELDQTYYQCEKLLKDNADKIDSSLKDTMERLLSESKTLLSKEEVDVDEMKALKEKLLSQLQAVGEHIYKKGEAKNKSEGDDSSKTGGDGNPSGKSGDDPIDVDYNKKDS